MIVVDDNSSDNVGVRVVEYRDRGGRGSESQFFIPIHVHEYLMIGSRTQLIQHFSVESRCWGAVRRGIGNGDVPRVWC